MSKLTAQEKKKLYAEVLPIAQEYRKTFIGDQNVIKDTFKTIEQLGFLLLRFPAIGNDTNISGLTIYKEPYNCIYINTRQNLGRQYMSCWHEVYHAYTGEGNGLSYVEDSNIDPIEFKADTFAGIILMPENLVKNYILMNDISVEYLSHTDIIKMQNYFRVGYSAMLTRIIQLYPQYARKLHSRYAIAGDNQIQRIKMKTKVFEVQGDLQLVTATNDVYFPQSFLDNIEFNLKENRISKEKAYDLLNVLERLGNDT